MSSSFSAFPPPTGPSGTPPSSSGDRVPLDDSSEEGVALTKSLAKRETRVVTILRVAYATVLLSIATLVCVTVYLYTRNEEEQEFQERFEDAANLVIDSFHTLVEHNLAAVAAMSTSITSYAIQTNQEFPFVTVPDFELQGSDLRAQSGSHLLHWSPLVTEEKREDWEEYASYTRNHWPSSYEREVKWRQEQDQEFGMAEETNTENSNTQDGQRQRNLQQPDEIPLTVLDDGTQYHPKLWSNGAVTPRGDEPEGRGYYLPLWQQSPVHTPSQGFMNLNIAGAQVISRNLIETMRTQKKAVLNYASFPIPAFFDYFEGILRSSQYRHDVEDLLHDQHSILAYPVFDSFDDDRELAGVLLSDIYWKILFSNLLPPKAEGIICVITNSANQTFAYRIDGGKATNLGPTYNHDPKYDHMEVSTNINEHLQQRASPQNKAYRTVQLSDSIQYTIRIYPSQDTAANYLTNNPALYTMVTLFAFLFAGILFLVYSYVVEFRQTVMTAKVIESINKAAETERDLNEFLSHEVRNPLSAAISASTFVTTAVNEEDPLKDDETRKYVREDMTVVNSSLVFINDFLRSMLDIYRAKGNQITIAVAPTDIKQDILEPVASMLYKRLTNFEVLVDCPPDLAVMTDSIRLKQVVINLARNASKFVETGFLRLRAQVVDQEVTIYVEDSGPGIPRAKQKELFAKYQESLDLLSQGTGIGLNLSKKLMRIMNGDIWLDASYDSGVEGCPGARFVVELKTGPIDIEAALPAEENDVLQVAIPNMNGSSPKEEMETAPAGGPAATSGGVTGSDGAESTAIRASKRLSSASLIATEIELPQGLNCLFVDDDAVLRKLFMRAVKKAAPATWTIMDASSGEMALRICETQSFDLVFMDQYMAAAEKQLLGTETAQVMRSRGMDCKICGLSANDLRDAFINAGADEFILKPMPCRPQELKGVLHRILSKNSPYIQKKGNPEPQFEDE
ncbi:respiration control sensor protein ArcB [Seminavis robusta]|uniref:histidine kinase n=1 Tax=Seminavis robusta TaxID=568900 RepID=A0A9N8EUY7_9STRA|nr:respiration control sensor protein ArcB [Seminavis robusta]|eukprot:Sro2287_g322030.1 respiration control sensor protein ArcB (965) ;mRNA; f:7413-10558